GITSMFRFSLPAAVACSLSILYCTNDPAARNAGVLPEDTVQTDLSQADARSLAPIGRETYRKLRDVAPQVTLGMLGEDDGFPCTATFRIGPAERLTAEEVLRLFGFNVKRQLSADTFSFQLRDPRDHAFWVEFKSRQDDAGQAQRVVDILS